MRVLHVIPSLHPDTGGPAQSVPALCRALQAAGVETTLYTLRHPAAPCTVDATQEQFTLRSFAPLGASRQLPTATFFRRLRKDLHDADLVHLHSLWNPVISRAAWACKRAGIPYIVSPRGMLQATALQHHHTAKTVYFKLCEHRTITNAAAVHFLSAAEAADSRKLLGADVRMVILPSGIDVRLGYATRKGLFRKDHAALRNRPFVLFLGRLHWSKGLDLQLAAMMQVFLRQRDCTWLLIGPDDGNAAATLRQQIAKHNLTERVVMTGALPHSRCMEALADADLLIMTSRHEAHSMAINEALAIGTPVVAVDTMQFPDLQRWGAGISVPAQADALADAIVALLPDANRRQAMGHAGRIAAQRYLAWSNIAAAMAAAYRDIVAVSQ